MFVIGALEMHNDNDDDDDDDCFLGRRKLFIAIAIEANAFSPQ